MSVFRIETNCHYETDALRRRGQKRERFPHCAWFNIGQVKEIYLTVTYRNVFVRVFSTELEFYIFNPRFIPLFLTKCYNTKIWFK